MDIFSTFKTYYQSSAMTSILCYLGHYVFHHGSLLQHFGAMKKVLFFFSFVLLLVSAHGQEPKADFDFKVEYQCWMASVSVINQSQNAEALLWDLHGNGNYKSINNPNPSLGDLNTDHDFTVSLIAQKQGLADTITKTYHLKLTKVSFDYTVLDTLQMAPLTVEFINTSQAANGDTLLSWLWEFGDETSSTEKNPTHVYREPHTYYARLRATTKNGCELGFHSLIIVKDTAQRDEFFFITGGCDENNSPCGYDKHFEIENNTLRMFGFYDGNCCTTKTATLRNSGDTIFVRTFQTGEQCNCTCGFCFSIDVPGIDKDSVIVSFDGNLSTARVVTSIGKLEAASLEVYPNPVAGELTVSCNRLSNQSSIVIQDLMGRVVYQLSGMLSDKVVIPCRTIRAGVYLLKVNMDQEHFITKKILITNGR